MIISFDPSGNHSEGFGTTGICLAFNNGQIAEVGEVQAIKYKTPEAYWNAHIEFLNWKFKQPEELEVVMEGFRLYAHKSATQTNSQFETPQLIGIIRHWCYLNHVPLKIQFAVEVKNRWSDEILLKNNYIHLKGKTRYLTANNQILNNHKTDAVRHALHYFQYTREKHLKEWDEPCLK